MAVPLEVWSRVRRHLLSEPSLEALRTLVALYGAVKELREASHNDASWEAALHQLRIGHSAHTPLVMRDYKDEQKLQADKRPAGPSSTAVGAWRSCARRADVHSGVDRPSRPLHLLRPLHLRSAVARHDHTERSGNATKSKHVLDAKALAKERVALKITKPLESVNFSLWSAAERVSYTLERAIPQDVRRAVRAKYAEPAVEVSCRMSHMHLAHSQTTRPSTSYPALVG